jgi:type IV fimbrial biogenesis protein FimT
MHTRIVRGFTLLELMAALAVLAVLLAVGVPSFFQITRNNRIAAQTNELVAALNLARSESVKRGIPVSVCASANGTACAGNTNWGAGWMVFTDGNGASGVVNPAVPVANGDQILQVWAAVQGGLQLTADRNFVQYTSTGMTNPVGTTRYDLYKPGCGGNYSRRISVSTTGRVSSIPQACP